MRTRIQVLSSPCYRPCYHVGAAVIAYYPCYRVIISTGLDKACHRQQLRCDSSGIGGVSRFRQPAPRFPLLAQRCQSSMADFTFVGRVEFADNKSAVEMDELQEAMERVIAGPEKKSRKKSEEDKKITAYHEAGHALMSYLIEGADPLHKVTIVSRGMAGGYTIQLPRKDRYYYKKSQLMGKITGLLGGRASEEITFHEVSSGAQDDIKRATELARDMVTMYGMSDRLGHLTFGKRHDQIFLGRDIAEERNYSEDTAKIIDEEVKKIVDECYETAKSRLVESRDKLDRLAGELLEKETLYETEVTELLGFPKREEAEEKPKKEG